MTIQSEKPRFSVLQGVLWGGIGLLVLGCTGLRASQKQGADAPTPPPAQSDQRAEVAQLESTDGDHLGLREEMPYSEARALLIQQGWQPHVQGDEPNLNDTTVRELWEQGYEEVKDCSGTGLGPCRFEFVNDAGALLVVSAITGGAQNGDRFVWRWFIEAETSPIHRDSRVVPRSDTPPFFGTWHFNFYGGSGTGQSITIELDGATTVEFHGTASSSIEYRGAFTNPLQLTDGTALLLENGKIYRLGTDGQVAQGCSGEGIPCESGLYEAAQPPILDGYYFLGGTDEGLQVSGDLYRYFSEGGEQAWRPVAELTAIREGVVFDGTVYWCLAVEGDQGTCTEAGWQSYEETWPESP